MDFSIGSMSMKNNHLAIHHINVRKDKPGSKNMQDSIGLDSPLTLSD